MCESGKLIQSGVHVSSRCLILCALPPHRRHVSWRAEGSVAACRAAGEPRPAQDGRSHTWSMAQGIRHGTLRRCANMCGKMVEKDGAAWMAQKAAFPTLSSSVKPKIFFTWLMFTCNACMRGVSPRFNRQQPAGLG